MFDDIINREDICELRILPYTRSERRTNNGEEYRVEIDNLSNKEIRMMSCQPRMLWRNNDVNCLEELPLCMRGYTGIKWSICYIFSDLTDEEQTKYFDRSIIIPVSSESIKKLKEEKVMNKKRTLFRREK